MPQVSRSYYAAKDIDVKIAEINDGIYRIAGFVDTYGITFNQFLINDERPILIHTGPIGMYKKKRRESKRSHSFAKTSLCGFFAF
jgi:flavorubredoxin